MDNIQIKSFGLINNAIINFADFTIFVGSNGSGKSILLQLIKLLADKDYMQKTVEQHGFAWGNTTKSVLERYFGEGMSDIWSNETEINFDGKLYPIEFLLSKDSSTKKADETLFYVPAQRVGCLQNGWPPFTDHENSYRLCPSLNESKKDSIKYVILEEPEMGLHPQAIESVILQGIDLISRDYKVIVSTHSPVLLEFAWAFQNLQKMKADDSVLAELFNVEKTELNDRLFKNVLKSKTINTYYFDRVNNKVDIKDISSLDVGSEDKSVAEWGGLLSFSSKAADIISRIVARGD